MRRPWKRFLAVLILVMLALLRVESNHARMQGRGRGPSRILRLERLPMGARVHLTGWAVDLPPALVERLAQTPSRVREGMTRWVGSLRAWQTPH